MMTKVLGEYDFELLPLDGRPGELAYWHYLGDADKHNRCFRRSIDGLPEGMSVVEHFGGVGMFAMIIRNVLKPSSHKIFDMDANCIKNCQHNLGNIVEYGDAKTLMGTIPADVIVLDYPNFTMNKLPEWDEALKRAFASNPKYLTFTDIANQRIGLHRDLYSKLVGHRIHTTEDYINALSQMFYERYGYSIRRAAHDHKATYILFTPDVVDYVVPERYTREGWK